MRSSNQKSFKYRLYTPDIQSKCVVIILCHTRNFVTNDRLWVSPYLRRPSAMRWLRDLGDVYSLAGLGIDEQIYQEQQNNDNYEIWQIFTLPVDPGPRKFEYTIYANGILLVKVGANNGFLGFWPIKSSEFEAKAGQFIYIGMLNFDAVGKRDGLSALFAGDISNVKQSWEPSAENIAFVREKIPELKDVNIIPCPITVEFEK
jgi:hypothetical protein